MIRVRNHIMSLRVWTKTYCIYWLNAIFASSWACVEENKCSLSQEEQCKEYEMGASKQDLLWSVRLQRRAKAALFILQHIRRSGGLNHGSITVPLQRWRKNKTEGWRANMKELAVETCRVKLTYQRGRSGRDSPGCTVKQACELFIRLMI